MTFDLVVGWWNCAFLQYFRQLCFIEIRHTDAPRETFVHTLLHGRPSFQEVYRAVDDCTRLVRWEPIVIAVFL